MFGYELFISPLLGHSEVLTGLARWSKRVGAGKSVNRGFHPLSSLRYTPQGGFARPRPTGRLPLRGLLDRNFFETLQRGKAGEGEAKRSEKIPLHFPTPCG